MNETPQPHVIYAASHLTSAPTAGLSGPEEAKVGIYLGPLRLTKRGVRIRIGPRAARLHVGAGGAGLSTGFGPFTAYLPLKGKHRKSRR